MKKNKIKIIVALTILSLLIAHQIYLINTEIKATVHFRSFLLETTQRRNADGNNDEFLAKEATNFEWDEAFYSRYFIPIQKWHLENGKGLLHTFGKHSILTGSLQFFKDNKLVMSMPLNIEELLLEDEPNMITVYPDLFRFTPNSIMEAYYTWVTPINIEPTDIILRTGRQGNMFGSFKRELERGMQKYEDGNFRMTDMYARSTRFEKEGEYTDMYIARTLEEAKAQAEKTGFEWHRYSNNIVRDDVSYACILGDGDTLSILPFYNTNLKFDDSITTINAETLLHGEYIVEGKYLYITLAQ